MHIIKVTSLNSFHYPRVVYTRQQVKGPLQESELQDHGDDYEAENIRKDNSTGKVCFVISLSFINFPIYFILCSKIQEYVIARDVATVGGDTQHS